MIFLLFCLYLFKLSFSTFDFKYEYLTYKQKISVIPN